MVQTTLKNQKSVKILRNDEASGSRDRITTDDAIHVANNCYEVPMVVFRKPQAIKKRRK